MAKVLIVEDDEVIARGMAEHLRAAGFDPIAVGAGGPEMLRHPACDDLVVLDDQNLCHRAYDSGEGGSNPVNER